MTSTFQSIGNCVDNPFSNSEELDKVIESGKDITYKTFVTHCEPIPDYKIFPNDYQFYKGTYQGKTVYWYSWSAIEDFYMEA